MTSMKPTHQESYNQSNKGYSFFFDVKGGDKRQGDLKEHHDRGRSMLTGGAKGSEIIWGSTDMSTPFSIDAKGGEKLDERGSTFSGRE